EACGAQFGTTKIKSHRLAHRIALADVIEQARPRCDRDEEAAPRIGAPLHSVYERVPTRAGPEYLHYLCTVYRVEPPALGYDGPCICGHGHRMPGVLAPSGADLSGRHGAALPEPTELRTPSLHPDKNPDSEEDENILRRVGK